MEKGTALEIILFPIVSAGQKELFNVAGLTEITTRQELKLNPLYHEQIEVARESSLREARERSIIYRHHPLRKKLSVEQGPIGPKISDGQGPEVKPFKGMTGFRNELYPYPPVMLYHSHAIPLPENLPYGLNGMADIQIGQNMYKISAENFLKMHEFITDIPSDKDITFQQNNNADARIMLIGGPNRFILVINKRLPTEKYREDFYEPKDYNEEMIELGKKYAVALEQGDFKRLDPLQEMRDNLMVQELEKAGLVVFTTSNLSEPFKRMGVS